MARVRNSVVSKDNVIPVGCFLARFAKEVGGLNDRAKALIADICKQVCDERIFSRLDILNSLDQWSLSDKAFSKIINFAISDSDFRGNLLFHAWRVASIDNKIEDKEVSWIEHVAQKMGASQDEQLR